MRTVIVSGPGSTAVVDVPVPATGPNDVLVRMRACGICGSDGYYITIGGIPPRQGATPLGHEPAGEVVEVGGQVAGVKPGDHVVVNPIAPGSEMIGSGGPERADGRRPPRGEPHEPEAGRQRGDLRRRTDRARRGPSATG